ncbi:DUF1800 family protein [Altererythrobacter indicus]|uniref:DUF1800 family protein n=1 Tax=Altericroceibacterium indicum TaxID=374177 RepID=A0A845ADZ2_9SPHN|nr:DUF1800 family protein [Altericroceibacterium indicum]
MNRFGLGAQPGAAFSGPPKRWLLNQLEQYKARSSITDTAPKTSEICKELFDYYKIDHELRREGNKKANAKRLQELHIEQLERSNAIYHHFVQLRFDDAVATQTPFLNRLIYFWSNHFAVSADNMYMSRLAGPFEFDAIRPNLMGTFGDMLMSVERHPAMLLYLNQAISVGANSARAKKVKATSSRKAGLNENLAREILELHTLGVLGGYDQHDVIEFAKALTGWTVAGMGRRRGVLEKGEEVPGRFHFQQNFHEPGSRTIMGRVYSDQQEGQAKSVLADLAVHPSTAHHIAVKLSRHFAGDDPPQQMVDRLEKVFLESGGYLPALYREIIASPEAWVSSPVKFKTPWEWAVSAQRALGMLKTDNVWNLIKQLGQPVWRPRQPAGYDDIASTWAGPDALMNRVRAANQLAQHSSPSQTPLAIAARVFPHGLSGHTVSAIERAESYQQAMTLLLVSPEMMRR